MTAPGRGPLRSRILAAPAGSLSRNLGLARLHRRHAPVPPDRRMDPRAAAAPRGRGCEPHDSAPALPTPWD